MRNQTCSVPLAISQQLDVLTKEMAEIGVAYVGHGIVSVAGNHTGYFSNPHWQKIYIENKFFHKEPILDVFLKNPLGAVHWQYVENNKVACIRRNVLGIVGGITLCNFYNSFFGFLNMGFQDDRDTTLFIKENKPIILAYHKNYDQIHLAWRILAFNERDIEK